MKIVIMFVAIVSAIAFVSVELIHAGHWLAGTIVAVTLMGGISFDFPARG